MGVRNYNDNVCVYVYVCVCVCVCVCVNINVKSSEWGAECKFGTRTPIDRVLATFMTPWGRYRYKVAPQGAMISGDAYTRRFDEIIEDMERKTKCLDDTAVWDDDL